MRSWLILIVVSVGLVVAQQDTPAANNPTFHTWQGRAGSPVNVCGGGDCWVVGVIAAPKAGGSGTVTFKDVGTACGGGPCFVADQVALVASTTNSFVTFATFCKGGFVVAGTGAIDVTVAWTTSGGYR